MPFFGAWMGLGQAEQRKQPKNSTMMIDRKFMVCDWWVDVAVGKRGDGRVKEEEIGRE